MTNLKLPTHELETLLLVFLLASILAACSSPAASRSPEDQIREYLYRYQPTTGQQFVNWADTNLSDYTPRQVHIALQNEGKSQAELGHPNAVGVLSFAAQAWAQEKGLQYDPNQWLALQQEAMNNLPSEPPKLQLWSSQ